MQNLNNRVFPPVVCSLLVGLFLLMGCQTTKVDIRVKVPSEINVDKYTHLAILPFVERTASGKKSTAKPEWGGELASLFRRSLNRPHQFQILSAKETNALVTGEPLDPTQPDAASKFAALGSELDVDAFVVGIYHLSSVSEPRRVYYDRYSATLQRYVTDSVIYYQKSYRLKVEVSVIDTETGEIVWQHPYEAKAWETHNVVTFLVSEAVQSGSVFRNLANQVAASFTRSVAPHYEKSERVLVKG